MTRLLQLDTFAARHFHSDHWCAEAIQNDLVGACNLVYIAQSFRMTATDRRSGQKRLPQEPTVSVTNTGTILVALVNRLMENFMVKRDLR